MCPRLKQKLSPKGQKKGTTMKTIISIAFALVLSISSFSVAGDLADAKHSINPKTPAVRSGTTRAKLADKDATIKITVKDGADISAIVTQNARKADVEGDILTVKSTNYSRNMNSLAGNPDVLSITGTRYLKVQPRKTDKLLEGETEGVTYKVDNQGKNSEGYFVVVTTITRK